MDHDQVFLTTVAPFKGLSYQTVGPDCDPGHAPRRRRGAPLGSHVLRHSTATQMLRHGLPLEAMGEVLRHASIETTAGYAKVDLQLLHEVVKPWPEVTQC